MSRHLVISNWHGCFSACLTICVGACVGCHNPSSGVSVQAAKVRVSPVASQCGADSIKFLQWHSSVGLFQLSFSNGVPVYPANIRRVAQWYPSVHWVNQWHSSGIPVYTGPTNVHWLRVGEQLHRNNESRCPNDRLIYSSFCLDTLPQYPALIWQGNPLGSKSKAPWEMLLHSLPSPDQAAY